MVKKILLILAILIPVFVSAQSPKPLPINRVMELNKGMNVGPNGSLIDSIDVNVGSNTIFVYSDGVEYPLVVNDSAFDVLTCNTLVVSDSIQVNSVWYTDFSSGGAPEGTAVLSTGETGGIKFLREDGDGTSSWQTPAGAGDMVEADSNVVWPSIHYVDSNDAALQEAINDTVYGVAEGDSNIVGGYVSWVKYDSATTALSDSIDALRADIGSVGGGSGNDLMSGLDASYSMYTLLGDSCLDNSGNFNNLYTNTVAKDSVGRLGKAFYFDGTDTDYLGQVDILDNQDITTSVWFKTTSNAQQSIASNQGFSGDYTGWNIFVDNEFTYQGEITVWLNIGGSLQTIHTGVLVDDGRWHNVILTSTSGNQYVYIDGRQVAATTTSGSINYTSSNFRIGGSESGWGFIGLIDEFDNYNRVLTSSERNQLIRLR